MSCRMMSLSDCPKRKSNRAESNGTIGPRFLDVLLACFDLTAPIGDRAMILIKAMLTHPDMATSSLLPPEIFLQPFAQ